MRAWAEIKYALNSTLGRKWFRSLDRLLAAKIAIRGYPDMEFHLKNNDTGQEFDVTLNEKDEIATKGQYTFRQRLIPVELGSWTIIVRPFNGGDEATKNLRATTYGQVHTFSFNTTYLIQEIIESQIYTVPSDLIYITASGGGGGGGGGGSGGNTYSKYGTIYSGAGGGGGGRGESGQSVNLYQIKNSSGQEISIIIGNEGKGGAGGDISTYTGSDGSEGTDGTAGGATIIGDFITLPGGDGGKAGKGGEGGIRAQKTNGGVGGNYGGTNGASGTIAQDSSGLTINGVSGGKGGTAVSGGNGAYGGNGGIGGGFYNNTYVKPGSGYKGQDGSKGRVEIYGGVYIP